MIRLLFPLVVLAAAAIGYWLGRRRPVDVRVAALREHARYLRMARRANLLGPKRNAGLVNIYAEAAERVLKTAQATWSPEGESNP